MIRVRKTKAVIARGIERRNSVGFGVFRQEAVMMAGTSWCWSVGRVSVL